VFQYKFIMEKIKVILADDHQMFRDGIKSVLSDEPDIQVVDEVSSGEELIKALNSCMPHVIITDISMPDMSGIDATRIITGKYPCARVLILSMHTNEEFIMNAIRAGASGYLPKDAGRRELLNAIRTISAGDEYFTNEVSQTIAKSYIRESKSGPNRNTHSETLTPREREIIKYVAEGLMNKEIADKLCISVRTVDTHKNNILTKLDLKSTVDLVKYAIKHQIIAL
jgi:DNA-binding NarL/FixJ family response regulator